MPTSMGKAQTLIVEFILFFMISFSLFAAISFFFNTQNTLFKERVGESLSELINDVISTYTLKSTECKSCIDILILDDIPSKIGGHYYKIELDQSGVNTSLILTKISKKSSLFNLNETFTFSGSAVSENKKIEMKINNRDERVEIK